MGAVRKAQKKYVAKKAPARQYERAAPARRAAAPRRQVSQASRKAYEPSLGRQLLEGGGSALGAVFGAPGIGRMAGSALSTLVGLGDYEVKKNVFMEGRLPQMVNIPKAGGTVIRFQEYLSDIYTTADISNPGAFNITSYLINAANNNTFPWLNQIAANYESYSFEGLVFEFRSTSADALNSTNTALGSVMMATQYDVADAIFASKAEMLNYEFSNSIKPSENCMHMIECAPGQNVLSELYTLDGAAPSGTDSRLYHLGRFCIATVGFQAANVNIGELHVTYQVRLLKPKLYASLGNLGDFLLMTNTTFSNVTPLQQDGWSFSTQNNFTVTTTGGTISIPASAVIKTYRIEVYWNGSTAAVFAAPVITVANCVVQSLGNAPAAGDSVRSAYILFSITTLGNSKVASFAMGGAGSLPTTPVSTGIRIMQVPQSSFS